jgi:hypothetical protein
MLARSLSRICRFSLRPSLTHNNSALFTSNAASYHPPESQLPDFIRHIHDLQNDESMQAAAKAMATLQAD